MFLQAEKMIITKIEMMIPILFFIFIFTLVIEIIIQVVFKELREVEKIVMYYSLEFDWEIQKKTNGNYFYNNFVLGLDFELRLFDFFVFADGFFAFELDDDKEIRIRFFN